MIDVKDSVLKRIRDDGDWGKDDMAIERFHPSSAGYCVRQMFLSKIKAKTFPDNVRGAMQCGTIVHNWIQSFEEIKKDYDIELTVKTDVPDSNIYFKGSADLVPKDKSCVIDLKTINGLSYVKMNPMKEHIYQILLYMKGLGIESGKIIYINKSDLEMVEHTIVPSPIRLNKAYDKAKKVYDAVKEWDAQPRWEKIPFEKCGCYHCRKETLDPQFLKLLTGEQQ